MGGKARSQTEGVISETTPFLPPEPARVDKILELLQQRWGHATCELQHDSAYQLLVATILSAQSTDRRVNMVTPALFARYPDPSALARADEAELQALIHSTGFFRMKAKSLLGMARKVMAEHGGEIPRTMEELTALPGVGRKTANVVLGNAFHENVGIVVDTHVRRLAQRLGFTREEDAEKIERELMPLIPQREWTDFSHLLIWHGRQVCVARKPRCEICVLNDVCPSSRV